MNARTPVFLAVVLAASVHAAKDAKATVRVSAPAGFQLPDGIAVKEAL